MTLLSIAMNDRFRLLPMIFVKERKHKILKFGAINSGAF